MTKDTKRRARKKDDELTPDTIVAPDYDFNLTSDADYFILTYMADKNLSKKGKEVTLKILETSRRILVEKGHGELTLREIAREAGIRLSNLQYYYPTRDDLMEDLLRLVFSIYHERYNQLLFNKDLSPKDRLLAMSTYLMINIRVPSIYKLFFEIWSFSKRSDYAAKLLSEMYREYCQGLEDMIADISPDMPPEKRAERAVLIAFLIEGVMIYLNTRQDTEIDIDNECIAQIQRMASWP